MCCVWISGAFATSYIENGEKVGKGRKRDELWVARFATREISPSEGQFVDGRRTGDTEDVIEVVGGKYLAYLPCTNVFQALSRGQGFKGIW